MNIVLALVWAGLLGSFDLWTLGSGFLLGYAALFVVYRGEKDVRYFEKPARIVTFTAYYLVEILRSNFTVALDILTPTHGMKPGIIAIPLEAKTDFEITLLANLITMTPGTLSLDLSEDRSTLYVHAMYIHDPEKIRASIKDDLERRVLEVFR
ncbi:MAG: Na+/H+ antiporter subunit E [Chthoniobacterales bacterium]